MEDLCLILLSRFLPKVKHEGGWPCKDAHRVAPSVSIPGSREVFAVRSHYVRTHTQRVLRKKGIKLLLDVELPLFLVSHCCGAVLLTGSAITTSHHTPGEFRHDPFNIFQVEDEVCVPRCQPSSGQCQFHVWDVRHAPTL